MKSNKIKNIDKKNKLKIKKMKQTLNKQTNERK